MTQLRTIDIDFDIHKKIETERRSFDESANDVLRRLLKIDTGAIPLESPAGWPWTGKGVTLPHGTELRMDYNGRLHTGRIHNGAWLVEGKQFNSPSAAAGGIALTKDGRHPSLDGWIYWHVRQPDAKDWVLLKTLRE